MRNLVLVTRTATANLGNEALSNVWRDIISRAFPGDNIILLERNHPYLRRYLFSHFLNTPNPCEKLDQIAWAITRSVRSCPATGNTLKRNIEFDSRIRAPRRLQSLRRALNLRGLLAVAGLTRRRYGERLGVFSKAALVIFNPAGEFWRDATDTPLAYLLDMRCAQLLGAKTGIVNVSLESEHPVLNQLIVHVLENADFIEFRDSTSLDRYRRAGGRNGALVLPDGVVLVSHDGSASVNGDQKRIAFAVAATLITPEGRLAVARLIDELQADGYAVSWTSNEWTSDEPFWASLPTVKSIGAGRQAQGFRQYLEHLAGFDVVVGSRLHTCVLAMNAGTAIVPLECNTSKVSGFFSEIGRGDQVISMDHPDWTAAVRKRIKQIELDRAGELSLWKKHRDEAVAHIEGRILCELRTVLEGESEALATLERGT